MVSIKRFLSKVSDKPDDAKARVLSLLIQALSVHAVEYNADAKRDFQETVDALTKEIEAEESSEQLLVHAGKMIHALQAYNKDAQSFIGRQGRELQGMIGMLTEAVVRVCGSAANSANNLRLIERELENTTGLEELRELKMRLGNQLAAMRYEIERQSEEYAVITRALEESSKQTAQLIKNGTTDLVTGLEDRKCGIAAIERLHDGAVRYFAAVLSLESLDIVNNRYGFAAGDATLTVFSQHLAKNLDQDHLFRWRGPSILAVITRDISLESARSELARLSMMRLDHTLDIGSRSVLIPISWSWTVFQGDGTSSPGAMLSQIDNFVSQKSSMASGVNSGR